MFVSLSGALFPQKNNQTVRPTASLERISLSSFPKLRAFLLLLVESVRHLVKLTKLDEWRTVSINNNAEVRHMR